MVFEYRCLLGADSFANLFLDFRLHFFSTRKVYKSRMADQPVIVNQPPRNNGNGAGAVWAGVLVIVLVLIFIFWGLPRIRDTGGNNINIPDEIRIETDTQ